MKKNILTQVLKAMALAMCLVWIMQIPSLAEIAAKKERTRMKLYYYKLPDGRKRISIGITAGSGRDMHGVANAEVTLNTMVGDSLVQMAQLTTDSLGTVDLYVEEDYRFPVNDEGLTYLEAVYDGNDTYRSADGDLEIMDLHLAFDFAIEDSVKYLTIKATRIDTAGNEMPVEELDVNIGVKRLYSILPIDVVETDEDGVAILEFPDDIPGDSHGMLTVTARLEEDEYGIVDHRSSVQWGVPVDYTLEPLPRQLYTDEAPLWMIAAVAIILLGAWYHFGLSIYKLSKIKKVNEA